MRTQLKRPECLIEALQSLSAQTDKNFEVILVLHSAHNQKELIDLLGQFPEDFREVVRTHQIAGGSRGVPLNVGIEASVGTHIAFFDDDDLVTSDWVAQFHNGANASPDCILRAQTATLWAERTTSASGEVTIKHLGEATADYARHFSLIDHLLVNHTPFMSLCFPAELFIVQGIRVDETLVVCEDWDLLLNASLHATVVDIPFITSFYRRWIGQETSYSEHSSEEWIMAEARVEEKLATQGIFLSGGEIGRIRSLLQIEKESHELRHQAETKAAMEKSISWKITYPIRKLRGLFTPKSDR